MAIFVFAIFFGDVAAGVVAWILVRCCCSFFYGDTRVVVVVVVLVESLWMCSMKRCWLFFCFALEVLFDFGLADEFLLLFLTALR